MSYARLAFLPSWIRTSIPSAQLKAADNRQARYALIVGETELAQRSAVLKDLNSGEQKEYPLEPLSEIIDAIRR